MSRGQFCVSVANVFRVQLGRTRGDFRESRPVDLHLQIFEDAQIWPRGRQFLDVVCDNRERRLCGTRCLLRMSVASSKLARSGQKEREWLPVAASAVIKYGGRIQ